MRRQIDTNTTQIFQLNNNLNLKAGESNLG